MNDYSQKRFTFTLDLDSLRTIMLPDFEICAQMIHIIVTKRNKNVGIQKSAGKDIQK